ncbi:Hypothetical protein FKW44_007484 [Caligus rogercresseyi]|uniref:Uncharacterized protein n=1 Tax=Caligus rogercresseyi TaxID=217165 RepID=A0A7T8KET4_CALRO|nr:Hypothetical protein FKW44_007484 [Caligus rogercresseyi]
MRDKIVSLVHLSCQIGTYRNKQWWALPLIIPLVRSSALSGGAIGERNAKSGSSL